VTAIRRPTWMRSRQRILLVVAAALLTSGCAVWSNSGQASHEMVRVPKEGNSWIGSIVPRLHRAGLRIAIPTTWYMSSIGGAIAIIRHPTPGSRVPSGSTVTLGIDINVGLPGGWSGRFIVPDVSGEQLRRATASLDAANLPWGVRAAPLPPTATASLLTTYCVNRQKPVGGTPVTIPTATHHLWFVKLDARPC
jgi:hypothetical protein